MKTIELISGIALFIALITLGITEAINEQSIWG